MVLIPRKRMSSDLLDPEPREGSFNGVTSDGVFKGTGKAIDNLLDDGSASETVTVEVPSSQSGDYTVGSYYEVQGKVAKLRAKTEGDNVTHLTFDTTSGILEAINSSPGKIAVFECSDNGAGQNFFTGPTYAELEAARTAGKTIVLLVHYGRDTIVDRYFEITYYGFGRGGFTYKFTEANEGRVLQFSGMESDVEHHAWSRASAYDSTLSSTSTNAVQNRALYATIGSIKNGGVLTDAASIDVPNNALSTLATAQATLTLNVNVDANAVPNFAVEVTPSADCTLTVTKTVGNATAALNPSVAGGNSLTTGKLYQVTCVGSCWTLAEFTVPTP